MSPSRFTKSVSEDTNSTGLLTSVSVLTQP